MSSKSLFLELKKFNLSILSAWNDTASHVAQNNFHSPQNDYVFSWCSLTSYQYPAISFRLGKVKRWLIKSKCNCEVNSLVSKPLDVKSPWESGTVACSTDLLSVGSGPCFRSLGRLWEGHKTGGFQPRRETRAVHALSDKTGFLPQFPRVWVFALSTEAKCRPKETVMT